MKTFILLIAVTMSMPNVAAAILPPAEVQSLVKTILDLRTRAESVQGEQQRVTIEQCERLTARLIQTKTKAADEALVVLMSFYIGESLQSDLVHEVTVRGKRMLPMLLKYRHAQVVFSNREVFIVVASRA